MLTRCKYERFFFLSKKFKDKQYFGYNLFFQRVNFSNHLSFFFQRYDSGSGLCLSTMKINAHKLK